MDTTDTLTPEDLDAQLLASAARTKPQRVKAAAVRILGAEQSHSVRAWTVSGDVD